MESRHKTGRANISFYNIKNIDFMKTKPDNFYDLAIVDPPYGIDLANMNLGIGKGKKASKIKNRKWIAKDWDKETPTPEYFEQLFRVSKNQIIWGGNYFNLPPCKNYIVWNKLIPEGLTFADCEFAWTSFDCAPKIFEYSAYLDKKNKFHPTQKPVKMYQWTLLKYAKPDFKILDTHGGSASIALACWDFRVDLDLCEIDDDYFANSWKRFELHTNQTQLF